MTGMYLDDKISQTACKEKYEGIERKLGKAEKEQVYFNESELPIRVSVIV